MGGLESVTVLEIPLRVYLLWRNAEAFEQE